MHERTDTMKSEKNSDIREKLSTLWIVVLVNMLFADIFSIMVELVNKNTLNIPGDVKVVMAIAAVVTNIPVLMIYLSKVLPYKVNRLANIIAGIFTIIYVIGGGDSAFHYLIIACVEIIVLIMIIVKSWTWKVSESDN